MRQVLYYIRLSPDDTAPQPSDKSQSAHKLKLIYISIIRGGEETMTDKKIIVQFTMLTFFIAFLVSGALIALGPFGYSVHNWVHTFQQFMMNIPFAIYILSPAIASYIVLKKNKKVADFMEWLKTVFYVKNNLFAYLFVVAGLALYFVIHIAVSARTEMALPFYTLLLSLPGNLIIGGLEEAGWM
ncbi:hypothetical protein LBW89_02750 [Paenibacillus sp. alder61]|nr:hypothetical protein [Paenibacillus sp. alder61]